MRGGLGQAGGCGRRGARRPLRRYGETRGLIPPIRVLFRSRPAPVGTRVIGLGYSLGNPLSFNQGTVVVLRSRSTVLSPRSAMNLLGGHGSSGGPILNLQGRGRRPHPGLGETNGAAGDDRLDQPRECSRPREEALCQGRGAGQPLDALRHCARPSAVTSCLRLTESRPRLHQPAHAHSAPPTLVAGSTTARAYNAHTIADKANHIPSPPVQSGDSVAVPDWNGYLRLALIGNQDPYGRRYQSTYVRCWSAAGLRTASAKKAPPTRCSAPGPGHLASMRKGRRGSTCRWERVPTPPGQHGASSPRRTSLRWSSCTRPSIGRASTTKAIWRVSAPSVSGRR